MLATITDFYSGARSRDSHLQIPSSACTQHTGDFPFAFRLFDFANPPKEKLTTAAPHEVKDKKVREGAVTCLRQSVLAFTCTHASLSTCTYMYTPSLPRSHSHTRIHTHTLSKQGKPVAPPAPKPTKPGASLLTVNQFSCDPCEGSVPPGETVEITTTFKAINSATFW